MTLTPDARSIPSPQRALRRTHPLLTATAAFAVLAFLGLHGPMSNAAEVAVKIPPLAVDASTTELKAGTETVVFAGGCFWGVQGVFQHTRGVTNAVSGYAGGSAATAHYELIGSGLTGHAEAVQVTFDPRQVSYAQLMQIFFSVVHDPTQLNRQGPDRGTQYRSQIFTTDAGQKLSAEKYIAQLDAAKVYPAKIVTQVAPLTAFYAAESYHQDYATLHPDAGYIATFDLPKIANLKTMFAPQYRADPVLVSSSGLAKR
jgi:peptide-methionine (S)-S-oxide reductase